MLAAGKPLAGFGLCGSALLPNTQKHVQKQRFKESSSEDLFKVAQQCTLAALADSCACRLK